ncbi:VIT1/CCC1 transporter family protein [Gordonia crocea]|uniref:VIT family protein n=1 Tax=Gordonia crocea TaxID=589162 RepID=A0A7M3SUS3_9ACTN|nr:VIT1/CCC1 transporter family protein [Gordonia crocea]GED96397.1 hypothetical protein nbrc107697_04360 [Gordonia crocea]
MRLPLPHWRDSKPDEIRGWITEVNDGIITVAGVGLGLAGAEVAADTTYAVVAINAFIGALTVLGVKVGERLADREAEDDLIAHEAQKLAITPDNEQAELISWFESKGVSPTTARSVADELSAGDALGAQLRIEYGVTDRTTIRDAWYDAAQAGLAFFIGALMPLLATLLAPWDWHVWWTIGIASVSLVVTSVVLSRLGHSNTGAIVVRPLALGLGTITISYLLGDLLL